MFPEIRKEFNKKIATIAFRAGIGAMALTQPNTVMAEERPQLGIGLDCNRGTAYVYLSDPSRRRLIVELANLTQDQKGVIGQEKPSQVKHMIIVAENGAFPSTNGYIAATQGDQYRLNAYEPTGDGSKPTAVFTETSILQCD